MMLLSLPLAWTLLGAAVLFAFQALIQRLYHNISIAKSTGLRYIIVPCYIVSVPWLFLQPIILPALDFFPESWTSGWLPFMLFGRAWNYGYEPFHVAGTDTLITVSPTHNAIITCDPEVSSQILRRAEFGKPPDLIELLNVFGPGLTGSDGARGRLYRKIAAPFFTDQAMDLVWKTSMSSIRSLMPELVEALESESENRSQKSLRSIMAKMTLHNVVSVCFGKDPDGKVFRLQESIPTDHQIGFRQTVTSVLDCIAIIAFVPRFILNFSPFPLHKAARYLSSELRRYLSDLQLSSHSCEGSEIPAGKQRTLLELLSQAGLEPSEIRGNTFSFLFAGHEANANTLTLALFLLALNPSIQDSLQRTIDFHLGALSSQDSTYSLHYPLFQDSLVAAVINEILRLFTILPFIPKMTPEAPSSVTVKGRTHILPANTLILISTSAAHRHPEHWPNFQARSYGSAPHPVSSFNPDIWLRPSRGKPFLQPQPGSFIPFSDGARGCLGRKFAMVELCAQLVGIFSEWKIEMVEYEGLGWEGSRRKAERILSEAMVFDMTLRPVEMVPVRFTRRHERKT